MTQGISYETVRYATADKAIEEAKTTRTIRTTRRFGDRTALVEYTVDSFEINGDTVKYRLGEGRIIRTR